MRNGVTQTLHYIVAVCVCETSTHTEIHLFTWLVRSPVIQYKSDGGELGDEEGGVGVVGLRVMSKKALLYSPVVG